MAKKKSTRKAAKSVSKKPKKAAKKATKKTATARKPRAKAMSEQEMMEQWQRAASPSDVHGHLAAMSGSFRAKTEFVMNPGAPAQVHDGLSENKLILGGRFLQQDYRGTMQEMPFEGRGYTGYDNASKRLVGIWMDTFSTGIMTSLGTGKPSAKKLTSVATGIQPSGDEVVFDCIIEVQDRDHHTYEMWTKAPNGKRYRAMRVEYVRA